MDRWARAFELHKLPEIGDMKPYEMMRQMKALLPPDSPAGTYFMAAFLLCLPADMIDHIISLKTSRTVTKWRNTLYASRRGNTVTAVNANHDTAINSVFQSLHAIHHPGVQATRHLIIARFCWPQMAKAITKMARACLHCQRGKVHRHVHLQPAEIPVPHCRFAHIHVDLVGPLLPSRGHTYLFTIIDQTSRWLEAIPLTSITAADCARALFAGWVSQFGVPATITSDRGAKFTSALWAGLCSLLNIQHSPTTAYHPQSNGLVERSHRRLKDALRSRAAAADWQDHPWVLLGIRAAVREDSEFSLAEAVYGSQLILPGQFINTAESPSPSFHSDL
jgi:transposase InsO family protein